MPRCCAVRNCKNNYIVSPELHYFGFPKDAVRISSWAWLIDRTDILGMPKCARLKVCSIHFEDRMYSDPFKTRLLPTAVPTIFPGSGGSSMQIEDKQNVLSSNVSSDVNLNINEEIDIKEENLVPLLSPTVSCQTPDILSAHTPRKEKIRSRLKATEKAKRALTPELATRDTDNSFEKFVSLCHRYLPKKTVFFVESQALLHTKKGKARRYSLEFKKFCSSLYHLSPKAYRYLSSIFSLPSKSSLELITGSLEFKSGSNLHKKKHKIRSE